MTDQCSSIAVQKSSITAFAVPWGPFESQSRGAYPRFRNLWIFLGAVPNLRRIRCEPLIRGSFGIVCYEVSTLLYPFKDMEPYQLFHAVIMEGRRPEMPSPKPSGELVTLMTSCWHQDQAQRPSGFEPVLQKLEELLKTLGGDPRDHRRDDFRFRAGTTTTKSPGFGEPQTSAPPFEETRRNVSIRTASTSPLPQDYECGG